MHEDKIHSTFWYGNHAGFICPQTETEFVQLFVMLNLSGIRRASLQAKITSSLRISSFIEISLYFQGLFLELLLLLAL